MKHNLFRNFSTQLELPECLLNYDFNKGKKLQSCLASTKIDTKIRNCNHYYLSDDDRKIVDPILSDTINWCNHDMYRYLITNLEEPAIIVYEKGEFYTWHMDSHQDPDIGHERKLSFTLQLSDPDEYEGGELEFRDHVTGEIRQAPKEKGVITIFHSDIIHRVKEVTKGTRKALVGWALGPPWK